MTDKEKLEKLNSMTKNTHMETLHIQYTEIGSDYLVATMPVNERVHQPMGLLHGGASVALAESVGSPASLLFVDPEKYEVRGIEISANHLRTIRNGVVTATAKIIHKGTMTHLWEIRITDEKKNLVSLCKLTNIIILRK
ncbi:MAG: thioesterase [Bacteroidetes bacterium]|nr:MAG: thioesterase [Bacteroidota bacterium]